MECLFVLFCSVGRQKAHLFLCNLCLAAFKISPDLHPIISVRLETMGGITHAQTAQL